MNAGWEVEGFIDRLTRRDDANSERLVLEAISHLRAFSRDCDAMRKDNGELRAEIEQLRAAHRHIQGIAEQAEVYHARMGASQTFAAIADAARAAPEPKPAIAPCDDAEFGMKP